MAYAGLADAYSFMGIYSVQRPRTAFASASAAVERALAIDPDLAGGAHVAGIHQASQRLELAGSRARVPPRAGARSNADAAADLSFVAHGAARRSRRSGDRGAKGAGDGAAVASRQRRSCSRAVSRAALRPGRDRMREEPGSRPQFHFRDPHDRHVPCAAVAAERSHRDRRADRVDVGPRRRSIWACSGTTTQGMARPTRCTTFSKSSQVSPPHDTSHRIARCTSTQERTTSTRRSSGKPRPMTTGRHPSTIFRLSSKTSTPIPVTAPTCGGWGCGLASPACSTFAGVPCFHREDRLPPAPSCAATSYGPSRVPGDHVSDSACLLFSSRRSALHTALA